jgi:hypothetical protein
MPTWRRRVTTPGSRRKVLSILPTCSLQLINSAAVNTGSKTYILRSILDPVIIDRAAVSDEMILVEESADIPSDGDDGDDFGTRTYGTIIAWTSSDQLGALGILHVILSVILVSGKVMSDGERQISFVCKVDNVN